MNYIKKLEGDAGLDALHHFHDINSHPLNKEHIMMTPVLEQTVARLHTERDGTFAVMPDLDLRRKGVWAYRPFFASEGYQVGGYIPTLTDPTERELAAWVAAIIADGLLYHFGVWTDADGARHWDASVRHLHLADALDVGSRFGEDYIWDWAAGACVKVPS